MELLIAGQGGESSNAYVRERGFGKPVEGESEDYVLEVSVAELTMGEKNRISHRARAVKSAMPMLTEM